MFDYHLHTLISFDGESTSEEMLRAAAAAGLKEICFTDHMDYDPLGKDPDLSFETADYNAAYDHLHHPDIKIRRGVEYGLMTDNVEDFRKDLQRRPFDFVIGSIHFVEDLDIYYDEFWQGKTVEQAEGIVLERTLACLQVHEDFDVLGHLTYVGKVRGNPVKRPVPYGEHRDLIDEILKTLVRNGKGLEINTSGMDRCGVFLPDVQYLRRFKELGGQIVTVGSDAHHVSRVGQHCSEACRLAREIFGHVCTFEDRKPIFHKL